mmetsp:Transcript_37626/g.70142  ORF Transcript_37626/g.70142 Transcript_37626/m.70142 type:complete len:459 (-) Transcript_37626:252-1628(-)
MASSQVSVTVDFQDCLSISGVSGSTNLQGADGPQQTRSQRSNSSTSSVTYRSVLTFDPTRDYPQSHADRGTTSTHKGTWIGGCMRGCAACIFSCRGLFVRSSRRVSSVMGDYSVDPSEPLLRPPEAPDLAAGPQEALMVVEEDEEIITIDGNPAGLQRLVDVLVHNIGGDAKEDPEELGPKLKLSFFPHSNFDGDFRECVRARMTANDFRQMMYILESIFVPLRSMTSLKTVMNIFMNQWIVKLRPVAMNLQMYKSHTKKEREAARSALTEEERENRQKYELQYRSCKLRSLMDDDNDEEVAKRDGGPLSMQAVIWTKCVIEFMCSIFNLYLQVCPPSIHSIREYLVWVESTGVHKSLPPPHRIFGDSNLHNTLPWYVRGMVSTALRAAKIGPKQIFNASMIEVFADSIDTVRVFRDNLRVMTCFLDMLLEDPADCISNNHHQSHESVSKQNTLEKLE